MPVALFARVSALCLGVALFAVAPAARADKLDQIIQRLASSDDFRVRTQAALALGASKTKRSVSPLCRGLGDPSSSVRAASAAALGKLHKGGRQCLERRLSTEKSAAVKSTIRRALASLLGRDVLSPAEPQLKSDTRVYLAIGKTTDNTGRNGTKIHALVRAALAKAAARLGGYAIAPEGETTAAAKKVLAKHKQLKALYLSPKVKEPEYNGGSLTVRVEVAIFSYPGKALKGMIPVKLTQQDVPQKDEVSENELIKMAVERLVDKLAQNLDRID
jgi:hypothetical protein